MQKVNQFGTMQMLAESLLDGFVKNKDILCSGNVGIGTGEGIDGELIIWNGKSYRVDGNGNITGLDDDFPIVYANVHKSNFKFVNHFKNITLDLLRKEILDIVGSRNIIFSLLIDGKFKYVDTRSAFKSKKPYPGLEEVAKNQVNFSKNNVEGYMIGYYTPVLYQGIGVPNYHQHFISKNFDFGGHVTDAEILSADVSIQFFSGIDIELPISNNDYKNANLTNINKLKEIINKSE